MKHLILMVGLCATAIVGPLHTAMAAPSPRRSPSLAEEIRAARRADLASFQAVASVRARVPELDRKKRGRLAVVSPLLRAVGPRALLPMLDALITTEKEPLSGTARTAWRVGLLEAVGALRDGRSASVLRRVLAEEPEAQVVRAAAAALGTLGDDASVEHLIGLASGPGPKQRPVIAGMGECRRLGAARALARLLDQRPGEEMARVLCDALGGLGSAWAWETPRLAALKEGPVVRATAAQALLDAFLRYGGAVRQAAETGILLVDEPRTLELISRARTKASAPLQEELGRLAARVQRNPIRPATAK